MITKPGLERLAAVDCIEELLAHLGRESLLRLAREAGLGGIGCSYLRHSNGSWCHGARGPGRRPRGSVSSRSDVAAAVSRAAQGSAQGQAAAERQAATHCRRLPVAN